MFQFKRCKMNCTKEKSCPQVAVPEVKVPIRDVSTSEPDESCRVDEAAGTNSNNLDVVVMKEEQIAEKEGSLLLRPTDSREADRSTATKFRSNIRRTHLSRSTGELDSGAPSKEFEHPRSTTGGDFYPPIKISEVDLSSSNISSISDINSFDDVASIETRFSQIINEQEDELERTHRKSLGCIDRATSCFESSLTPNDMANNNRAQSKRRLSLCAPTKASMMVKDSLKNLANSLRNSMSNLSICSYDRDIEATIRSVKSTSKCCSSVSHCNLRSFSPAQTVRSEKLPESSEPSPKIEISQETGSGEEKEEKLDPREELPSRGIDDEQSEEAQVANDGSVETPATTSGPEIQALDKRQRDDNCQETSSTTVDIKLNSQVERNCSTKQLELEDCRSLNRAKNSACYECCSIQ